MVVVKGTDLILARCVGGTNRFCCQISCGVQAKERSHFLGFCLFVFLT